MKKITSEEVLPSEIVQSDEVNPPCLSNAEQLAVDGLLQPMTTEEKATQVKSGDITIPFIASIDSDKKLCSVTGLHSFTLLELLVKLVSEYFPTERQCKLTVKEKIFMTFMKMKMGLRYVVLASLFGTITSKTCKIIFHDMISKLAFVLKPLITWTSLEECQKKIA